MRKFGQEVILTITNGAKETVLNADGLRVDFDVRVIAGFSRASVTVYNLNDETIGALIGGTDNYCTITTRLHGKQEFTVMDKFYISNAIDEKKIPETITTLYCYDRLRKSVLEKAISITVPKPTLRRSVAAVFLAGGHAGAIEYTAFPGDLEYYVPVKPKGSYEGSVQQCMRELGNEYSFNMYTKPEGFLLVYKPLPEQIDLTTLNTQPVLVLHTNNMRANPKIAPAQLQVVSNLDGNIQPGVLLDISQLLTAGTSTDETTLQLAAQFAQKSLSGYSRYQALTIQHKGSNYTGTWSTTVSAVAPTRGINMPTQTWWK